MQADYNLPPHCMIFISTLPSGALCLRASYKVLWISSNSKAGYNLYLWNTQSILSAAVNIGIVIFRNSSYSDLLLPSTVLFFRTSFSLHFFTFYSSISTGYFIQPLAYRLNNHQTCLSSVRTCYYTFSVKQYGTEGV